MSIFEWGISTTWLVSSPDESGSVWMWTGGALHSKHGAKWVRLSMVCSG